MLGERWKSTMKRLTGTIAGLGFSAAVFVLLAGCGASTTGAGRGGSEGAKYLLQEEPAKARGIVELRGAMEESGNPAEVVLLGRVGGLGQPTWDPERAAFMVADLSLVKEEPEHDETPKHDADACPFCRAKKKQELAGLAMIQVVDENGETPATDARQLLGLEEGQTIVVRGNAQIDGLGTLVVRTSGIYIKPDGED